MIFCSKPEHYRAQRGWEIANGHEAQPVIVTLDPRRVYASLMERGDRFEPIPVRLERAKRRYQQKWTFELPDIRVAAPSRIRVLQGRHRTAALAELGVAAYPVVTTHHDAASLLTYFGASAEEARRHFDWSVIGDYPLVEFRDREQA